MSWAAHNPEKYDEITRRGILHWVNHLVTKNGFEATDEWREGYEALIEVLQTEPQARPLYEDLMYLASKDILHAEQDYFGGLIDHAMERHEN